MSREFGIAGAAGFQEGFFGDRFGQEVVIGGHGGVDDGQCLLGDPAVFLGRAGRAGESAEELGLELWTVHGEGRAEGLDSGQHRLAVFGDHGHIAGGLEEDVLSGWVVAEALAWAINFLENA